MSVDFSTLKSLAIPEGAVVKIEDAAGNVIWAVQSEDGKPIILEVEKITSDTYAAETTYTGESFILLDIYPKTNGTVTVAYGGLTKTITDTSGAAEPNAQQVFFGTFNGVSDSVETPASGTLTIEGGCVGVGVGSYNKAKASSTYCSCVSAITEWGGMTEIPDEAFYGCNKLDISVIPEGITDIGSMAFYTVGGISVTLPSTLKSVYEDAFSYHLSGAGGADEYYCFVDKLIMLSEIPPTLVNVTSAYFPSKDSQLILVPKGCVETYRTAEEWCNYASRIFEIGCFTFSVLSTFYVAAKDMTWAEWVESEYNTDGHYISGNYVMRPSGSSFISGVIPTDIIVEGYEYDIEFTEVS